ncbi:MAG: hypothetical protein KC466_00670 [Myxococcales bacterium]|nr:hypothetical protein [Myxococcales bacterium]
MTALEALALHGLTPDPVGGVSARPAGARASDSPAAASGAESPSDTVTISAEARALGQPGLSDAAVATSESDTESGEGNPASDDANDGDPSGSGLSEADQERVDKLKARDREVRAHEQAHKATGGAHAGGIQYAYETGPDGRRYAVGGEVSIDVSPVSDDPGATIRKLEQVRRAALAPADPSGQDRAVAAQAAAEALKAQAELAQARTGAGEATAADGSADGDAAAPSAQAASTADPESPKSARPRGSAGYAPNDPSAPSALHVVA